MATVQSIMTKLAQRVDPFTKSGVEITSATIGTVDGDRFTKQRLLDCYNDARYALYGALKIKHPDPVTLGKAIGANITTTSTYSWTQSSFKNITGAIEDPAMSGLVQITSASHGFSNGSTIYITGVLGTTEANGTWTITVDGANTFLIPVAFSHAYTSGGVASTTTALNMSIAYKPSGYLDFVSMSNSTLVPMILERNDMISEIREGINPHYIQSSNNICIFDFGNSFVHFGSYVPTASTYNFTYFGISAFTLSDVTGGSTLETFNDQYIPMLLELAQAISLEQGINQINALATKLLGQ